MGADSDCGKDQEASDRYRENYKIQVVRHDERFATAS
jgi:hypothetical protein